METKVREIVINGVAYVPKGSENSAPIGDKRIIVADQGWVFIGDCLDNEDGSVTIYNAKNIRRWGTTKGLGQLAEGPLENTVCDNYGTVITRPIITIGVIKGW